MTLAMLRIILRYVTLTLVMLVFWFREHRQKLLSRLTDFRG